MKKLLALVLALALCVALVACGRMTAVSDDAKIEAYVAKNGDELVSSMEQSFAASSGYSCNSTIKAVDGGIVVDINVNELDNLTKEQKDAMQAAYDSMDETFDGMFNDLKKELPEIKYMTMNVNEGDGDLIAAINMGK